jgi:hypothetical protein
MFQRRLRVMVAINFSPWKFHTSLPSYRTITLKKAHVQLLSHDIGCGIDLYCPCDTMHIARMRYNVSQYHWGTELSVPH